MNLDRMYGYSKSRSQPRSVIDVAGQALDGDLAHGEVSLLGEFCRPIR